MKKFSLLFMVFLISILLVSCNEINKYTVCFFVDDYLIEYDGELFTYRALSELLVNLKGIVVNGKLEE